MHDVRVLTISDWRMWKEIRLEGVKLSPEAFGGAYEDEVLYPDEKFMQRLEQCTIFGVFINDDLVAVAGLQFMTARKVRHRGSLFSVYIRPAYRGSGISTALIGAVVNYARPHIVQLHCSVVTTNSAAIKLYQKFGFKIYGTEPRSLLVNGVFYDEHLMQLSFD